MAFAGAITAALVHWSDDSEDLIVIERDGI